MTSHLDPLLTLSPEDTERFGFLHTEGTAFENLIEGVAIENNVVEWVLGKAKVTDKAAVFDELMGQKQ